MEVEIEGKRMQAKSQPILQAPWGLTVNSEQCKSAVDFTIQVAAETLGYNFIFTIVHTLLLIDKL